MKNPVPKYVILPYQASRRPYVLDCDYGWHRKPSYRNEPVALVTLVVQGDDTQDSIQQQSLAESQEHVVGTKFGEREKADEDMDESDDNSSMGTLSTDETTALRSFFLQEDSGGELPDHSYDFGESVHSVDESMSCSSISLCMTLEPSDDTCHTDEFAVAGSLPHFDRK